jgi:hypothetical protein
MAITLDGTTGITASGNITGSYILGNGSQLTGIDATSIQNGTSNVRALASGNVTVSSAGVANVAIFTSTGANITGTLNATGNANVGNLGTSGNISASYFLGNGSQLTGIDATAIQNGSANVRAFLNGNVTVSAAGTANVLVVTSTGANIAGTLDTGTGNANVGNLGATSVVATNLTGTLQTAAQTNITSVGTLGSLSVTGNVSGGNLNVTGNIVDTGALSIITAASGNVSLAPNGTNVLVATTTGANITGTLNATGNANVGNLGAATVTATTLTGTLSTAAQTSITSVGTLGSLAVTAAITGGSLGVSTGNITGGNLILSGAIEDSAQLDIRTTASNGNIVLTPNGTGVILVVKDIVNGQANGVGNIGSSVAFFNTVFAKATSAQYADLAESYTADADYAPGTVLVFGGTQEVTISNTDSDRRIAGVVSTNPSYIMNSGLESNHVSIVALQGRVPTKVTGKVSKGDLMVSAGNGHARAEQDPKLGAVIGKALEDFDGNAGVIEVVVGRI